MRPLRESYRDSSVLNSAIGKIALHYGHHGRVWHRRYTILQLKRTAQSQNENHSRLYCRCVWKLHSHTYKHIRANTHTHIYYIFMERSKFLPSCFLSVFVLIIFLYWHANSCFNKSSVSTFLTICWKKSLKNLMTINIEFLIPISCNQWFPKHRYQKQHSHLQQCRKTTSAWNKSWIFKNINMLFFVALRGPEKYFLA